jgi:hypothetical protein
MKKTIKLLLGISVAAAFAFANVSNAKANDRVAPTSLKVATSQSFKATVDAAPPGWFVLFGSGWVLVVPGK